ncbi:uncharacterized protein [Clytia hemisphaerica]|uniref:Mab-21-like HhH/H2TH-like domain-containing protein n=1 Tax=Clytia hemisphaerica TaxID=252671 RepID=A0A7M5WRK8_9CNID
MDWEMDSRDEENRMNLAKFILKTSAYEALFFDDEVADTFDVMKTNYKISHLMFPIVTKAIKSGSRSERAYLDYSDYDFIYEIGPFIVNDIRDKQTDQLRLNNLWYKETNHAGFYTVCDDYDGYLTPVGLQTKVKHQTDITKGFSSNEEPKATMANKGYGENQNYLRLDDKEDKVIGLRCKGWPKEIWETFNARKRPHLKKIMKKLKDCAIYLIPKAHPDSQDPWVEWRMSFSMVEKEIMRSLPHVYRKVFLICKEIIQWKVISYNFKTVFLWQYEEWTAEGIKYEANYEDIFEMVQCLLTRLYDAYQRRVLPQYFNPSINLFDQQISMKDEPLLLREQKYSKFDENDMVNVLKKYTETSHLLNEILGGVEEYSILEPTLPFKPLLKGMVEDPIKKRELDQDRNPSCYNIRSLCSKIVNPQTVEHWQSYLEEIMVELYITFLFFLNKAMITRKGPTIRQIRGTSYVLYHISVTGKDYLEQVGRTNSEVHSASSLFKGTIQSSMDYLKDYFDSLIECLCSVHKWFEEARKNQQPLMYFPHFLDQSYWMKQQNARINKDLIARNSENVENWLTGVLDEEWYEKCNETEEMNILVGSETTKETTPNPTIQFQHCDSETFHKIIGQQLFYTNDQDFKNLVEGLNKKWRLNLPERLEQEKDIQKQIESYPKMPFRPEPEQFKNFLTFSFTSNVSDV